MGLIAFFKRAFGDMKRSARAQHEVDRAELDAVRAESRANFEENRGHNSFARAKAQGKQSWDDAHMTPAEREARVHEEQAKRIAEAEERTAAAEERLAAAKKKKN